MTVTHRVVQQLVREPLTDPSEVGLHALHEGQWRVLDRRLPSDDVRALLGFAERVAGLIEVTLINEPGSPRFCATEDDARNLFLLANSGRGKDPLD